MPVEFFNEATSIKVYDTNTRLTSYFNKEGLVLQAMTDPVNLSFFLRSDGYTGYYKYSDVKVPSRPNIESLMKQIGTWAFDKLYTEIFTNEAHAVMQVKVPYDKSPMYIDEVRNDVVAYPFGTGTVAGTLNTVVSSLHDRVAREVLMIAPVASSLTHDGGRIVRQTKAYNACPSDKYLVATVSGTLLDPDAIGNVNYTNSHTNATVMASSKGTRYRIGVFDDENDTRVNKGDSGNGVYVEYHYDPDRVDHLAGSGGDNYYAVKKIASLSASDATSYAGQYVKNKLWVVLRTNVTGSVVESRVPRFDWSDTLSKADGSLVDLDPTSSESYVFRWTAASGMKVSVGVLYFGVVNWIHEFDISESPAYRLGSSTLPVRWELDNRDGGMECKMRQGRAAVSSDGMYEVSGRPYSFDTHMQQRTLTSQTPVPIMSIRLRNSSNRGKIHPQRLSLMNRDAGGVLKYELRLNATLTGATFAKSEAYSYDDASGDGLLALSKYGSFTEVDVDATAVSGGVTLTSGYFTNAEFRDIALEFREINLVSNIAGFADTLTLVCTYIHGAATISGGLNWLEYD